MPGVERINKFVMDYNETFVGKIGMKIGLGVQQKDRDRYNAVMKKASPTESVEKVTKLDDEPNFGKLYAAQLAVAPPVPNVPLVHPNEVALRIIVLVYNRPDSLRRCLNSIIDLDTDGDKVALDIFIDKGKKDGRHHEPTIAVAMGYKWAHGPVRVHLQKQHVGIYGQWIDSWRPKENSKEIAVIIEDDLDLSKYFWKWLKAAKKKYENDPEVQGFSLRGNAIVSGPRTGQWLSTSETKPVFMYKLIGSHGYAPLAGFWREFQDWFHKAILDKNFHPYQGLPGMQPVGWYKGFEAQGTHDTMWEMWCIYYGWLKRKFVIYPNISKVFKIKGEVIVHRSESGLHGGQPNHGVTALLLREWRDEFIKFPDNIDKFDWTGKLLESYNGK